MSQVSTIGRGTILTNRTLLVQDPANSIEQFTANAKYQDFTLFGMPAQHMILGVKISILVNFDIGTGNTCVVYVGNPSVFPANPTSTYVTNIHDCYGYANLVVPAGSGDSYQYGSFRWFTLSTPGSTNTISPAYCLPKRLDAHDVIARVVVGGSDSGIKVNLLEAGVVDISVQYEAI